jgi:hypothetical protein
MTSKGITNVWKIDRPTSPVRPTSAGSISVSPNPS